VKRSAVVAVIIFVAAMLLFAAKEFTMPRVERADRLAAHETHPDEKVTVGVKPYLDHDQSDTFGVKYSDHDYVPVLLAITNDRGESIGLSDIHLELVTTSRTKLLPATTDDVLRRLSRTERRGDESNRTKLPIPLPRKGPKTGAGKGVEEEIEAAQFGARAVEPGSTRAGFLFFDIKGVRDPLQGAKLYITGMRDAAGQELMFFEIPLDRTASTGSSQ
jgi:hypothetical protein